MAGAGLVTNCVGCMDRDPLARSNVRACGEPRVLGTPGYRVPSCLSRAPRRTALGPQRAAGARISRHRGAERARAHGLRGRARGESTPVSQQLQRPLRGCACDPRCWTIFFRASRGILFCALARAGVCAPQRARQRARRRAWRRQVARRTAHLPEQVLRRRGAARAYHTAAEPTHRRSAWRTTRTLAALTSLARPTARCRTLQLNAHCHLSPDGLAWCAARFIR